VPENFANFPTASVEGFGGKETQNVKQKTEQLEKKCTTPEVSVNISEEPEVLAEYEVVEETPDSAAKGKRTAAKTHMDKNGVEIDFAEIARLYQVLFQGWREKAHMPAAALETDSIRILAQKHGVTDATFRQVHAYLAIRGMAVNGDGKYNIEVLSVSSFLKGKGDNKWTRILSKMLSVQAAPIFARGEQLRTPKQQADSDRYRRFSILHNIVHYRYLGDNVPDSRPAMITNAPNWQKMRDELMAEGIINAQFQPLIQLFD